MRLIHDVGDGRKTGVQTNDGSDNQKKDIRTSLPKVLEELGGEYKVKEKQLTRKRLKIV